MRIHTDTLTYLDVIKAAEIARVDLVTATDHNSRSRARAFDVKLEGESRRRTMSGAGYAATWDQWGVFLAILFDRDPNMICGSVKHPTYADRGSFHARTDWRFFDRSDEVDYATGPIYWPADAHGDHTFRYAGIPCERRCTKCTAVQRWAPYMIAAHAGA